MLNLSDVAGVMNEENKRNQRDTGEKCLISNLFLSDAGWTVHPRTRYDSENYYIKCNHYYNSQSSKSCTGHQSQVTTMFLQGHPTTIFGKYLFRRRFEI